MNEDEFIDSKYNWGDVVVFKMSDVDRFDKKYTDDVTGFLLRYNKLKNSYRVQLFDNGVAYDDIPCSVLRRPREESLKILLDDT